jgi:N-methylhydantoinase A
VRPPAGDGGEVRFADFVRAFEEAHRREYGYDVAGRPIEVVNCRLKAVGRVDRPESRFSGGGGGDPRPRSARQVNFDSAWLETPIYDRAGLPAGARLAGPAIIDEMSSTTVVDPGQSVIVDAAGNLIVETAV